MDKFEPYWDKIVVEPKSADIEWRSAGDEEYGKVVKVGNRVGKLSSIIVGDTLYFKMRGVDEIKLDGKTYYVIEDNSAFILGITRETPTLAE